MITIYLVEVSFEVIDIFSEKEVKIKKRILFFLTSKSESNGWLNSLPARAVFKL